MLPTKTATVARQLNVNYQTLFGHIRRGKISPLPAKDSSGDFIWSPSDIERARVALATDRRRKAVEE
jgi:hypothetical protein